MSKCINARHSGILNAKINLVISDNASAFALERAKKANIPTYIINNKATEEIDIELENLLKNYELLPISLENFNQAVVTAGGVNLKEINPKYMKSKLVSNLYFIGEVLDIDALTGGFNLQLAFSTAVTCASDFKDIKL